MSELKKANVTGAVYSGQTFTNDYGTFYIHNVSFDNGDAGATNSKSPEGTRFIIGQLADYEIERSTNPQHPHKIKFVNPNFQQSTVPTQSQAPAPVQQQQIKSFHNRGFALSYAKDLFVGKESIDVMAVIAVAEKFNDWLDGKSEQPVQQQQQTQVAPPTNEPEWLQ